MRQHGLALFVRPHNAARLVTTTTLIPAGHFVDPPSSLRVLQVRGNERQREAKGERAQTLFEKATY